MTRRKATAAASLLCLALALAGCAPSPMTGWRTTVTDAADQAAAGDYAGADAALVALEDDVRIAQSEGRIDGARAEAILASAAALRAELQGLLAPPPPPVEDAPSPAEESPSSDDVPAGPADGGRDDDDDSDKGRENDGKGKGKDKANEKGKNKDDDD